MPAAGRISGEIRTRECAASANRRACSGVRMLASYVAKKLLGTCTSSFDSLNNGPLRFFRGEGGRVIGIKLGARIGPRPLCTSGGGSLFSNIYADADPSERPFL